MKDHAHAYITTQSRQRLALPNLHVTQVRVEDIAHSLSLQCRFMGHVRKFLSVAEHCVMVCNLAERDHGFGSDVARVALVHDAAEAYAGDFPSPLKKLVTGYEEFEHEIKVVVADALRVPPPDDPVWAQVKTYDVYALFQEAATLFSPPPPWVKEVPSKYEHPIHCLPPEQARQRYICRLREYGWNV